MLGIFQLSARPHHSVDILGTFVQSNGLGLECVELVLKVLPLVLQSGKGLATCLEAGDQCCPVGVQGRVLTVNAFAVNGIGLTQNCVG